MPRTVRASIVGKPEVEKTRPDPQERLSAWQPVSQDGIRSSAL